MFSLFKKKNKPRSQPVVNAPRAVPNVTKTRTRIPVAELKLGMYVHELDRPWSETSFLFQGFTLDTVDDISAVQDQCEYVVVESLTHQVFSQHKGEADRVLVDSGPLEMLPSDAQFAKDFKGAGKIHTKAKAAVESMFSDMQLVSSIDGEAVKEVVDDCVSSILKNPDAMLWYTQIQKKDAYLSQHSLNVAILAITVGRHLELRDFELEDLGTCALLHDVGKTSLPSELVRKKGALTDREQQILKGHTIAGRNILLSSKAVFSGAADVAFSHHERVDGSGYPRGVEGSKIPYYSKLIGIVDTYDNLVNSEVFGQTRSSSEALQHIYDSKDGEFDNDLVLSFIECVGVYPPGSLIEMTNGEVGIVLSNNSADKLRPRIILLLDENKEPRSQRVVDLTQLSGDPESNPYHIKSALRNRSYDIDVEDYIRAGLRIDTGPQAKKAS